MYTQAAAALQSAQRIIVTTHLNPDGDGLGAGLALVHALDRLGKDVRFLCPSKVASLYGFLPGFARIRTLETLDLAAVEPEAQVVISCDAGDKERLGAVWNVRRERLINLDHHLTNTHFGEVNLVDVTAESSGVVVSRLLKLLGVPLDRILAELLYTTIVFDTGRFMHSNTTAQTLRWAADLLELGIDASAINRKLTYTRTPKDLALMRLGLEHLAVDQDARIAGIALSQSDVAPIGEPEDWGDLVELPRSLIGNQIAYLVRERPAKEGGYVCKLSLRSNPPFVVGAVAQHYGGGGHAQAAGATVPGRLDAVLADLVPRLRLALVG